MTQASQLFHGPTSWGSASKKTQLYWVVIVAAALLIGVRVTSHFRSAPPPAEQPVAVAAVPQAQDESSAESAEQQPAEATQETTAPATAQTEQPQQQPALTTAIATELPADPAVQAIAPPLAAPTDTQPAQDAPAVAGEAAVPSATADPAPVDPQARDNALNAFATSTRRLFAAPDATAEEAPADEQPTDPSFDTALDVATQQASDAQAAHSDGSATLSALVEVIVTKDDEGTAPAEQPTAQEPEQTAPQTTDNSEPPAIETAAPATTEAANDDTPSTGPTLSADGLSILPSPTDEPSTEASASDEGAAVASEEPATAASEASDAQSTPDVDESAVLVLINSPDNGAPIRYLINGHEFSLAPGKKHPLPVGQAWRLRFHRGGNFGEHNAMLEEGTFEFRVTEEGWQLAPSAGGQLGAANIP